jgi:hypothetical protein
MKQRLWSRMTKPIIPEREPIGDSINGIVLQAGAQQILAREPLPGMEIVASGALIVRYGIRFLGKFHLSIVPGLVVMDYGDFLTGDDAWTFLLKGSHRYPRSEVVGFRNDGVDDMQFIRALDLAAPIQALVYEDAESVLPIARPAALIAPDTTGIASRILEFLPHYAALADWQLEAKR